MPRTRRDLPRGASAVRRLQRAAAHVLILLLAVAAGANAAADIKAELKTQMLERITRFVEWPASSKVSDASVPFVIGVLGDSAVHDALKGLAGRATIKGKEGRVSLLASPGDAGSCQVVYVTAAASDQLGAVLTAVAGKPILVVAEKAGLGVKGAMVNFVEEGEFLRFEVNEKAANKAGLKLASQLLQLGKAAS